MVLVKSQTCAWNVRRSSSTDGKQTNSITVLIIPYVTLKYGDVQFKFLEILELLDLSKKF